MCCEPVGSSEQAVDECHVCGANVDVNDEATEVCGYSPSSHACTHCGSNPCTGYC